MPTLEEGVSLLFPPELGDELLGVELLEPAMTNLLSGCLEDDNVEADEAVEGWDKC